MKIKMINFMKMHTFCKKKTTSFHIKNSILHTFVNSNLKYELL